MSKKKPNEKPAIPFYSLIIVGILTFIAGIGLGIQFERYQIEPSSPGHNQISQSPKQNLQPPLEHNPQVKTLLAELEKDPNNNDALIKLGNFYFDHNRAEKAITYYTRALKIDPRNADVWTDLGVMYRRSGSPDQAIESFDKAIEINPKHEVSRFNKGIVLLYDLHDRQGAIKAWEGLVTVNEQAMSPDGQSIKSIIQSLKNQ